MLEHGTPLEAGKEQISGKSKAGLLYTVGSKHMEPLSPELVPTENINIDKVQYIHAV